MSITGNTTLFTTFWICVCADDQVLWIADETSPAANTVKDKQPIVISTNSVQTIGLRIFLFIGILIPIVLSVFGSDSGTITIIAISACMAGAVCGDHCSPISDTTIMASAGAQCNHINHVSTQLPYAVTVAGVSFVCYIIAGFIRNWLIVLPLGIVLMIGTLLVIRALGNKKA